MKQQFNQKRESIQWWAVHTSLLHLQRCLRRPAAKGWEVQAGGAGVGNLQCPVCACKCLCMHRHFSYLESLLEVVCCWTAGWSTAALQPSWRSRVTSGLLPLQHLIFLKNKKTTKKLCQDLTDLTVRAPVSGLAHGQFWSVQWWLVLTTFKPGISALQKFDANEFCLLALLPTPHYWAHTCALPL